MKPLSKKSEDKLLHYLANLFMIGIENNKIVYVPFAKAIKNDKPIDKELVNVLHELSI